MRPRNGIIAALLMVVLLVLLPPAAHAAEVRLVPTTASATVGDVVPLAIKVDSVTNLAGFQFDFSFVPAALEVKKITIAPAFEHLVRGSFDNAAGSGLVAAYGVSAVPVSGTNITLATLEFTVKASGPATVNFANQLLGAYGGDEIPSTKGTVAGALITSKLLATVTLAGLAQPYDGTPKTVTATTEPPDLPVTITYDGSAAAPVNIGSYAVAATVNHADYGGSASGTLIISASYPFRIVGNPPRYYPTLAEAYRNAIDTDVIEIRAGTVVEDLIADRSVGVTLKGGFDDLFSPNRSGFTSIQGTISLRAGKVIMDGIRVKGASAGPDTTPPAVTLVALPPLTALTVQLAFSASDAVGVTGYMLSESPVPPSAADPGWLASPATSYSFGTFGDKTLYGYARDAAGNVGSVAATFGVYAPTQQLTVVISPGSSGTGTVRSSPPGITCASGSSDGCAAVFSYSPQGVDLVAEAATGSVFGGWSGACSGMGACNVNMSNPHTVTATFTAAPYVRIAATSFTTLQDAYDKARSGDEIMLQEGNLAGQIGALTANRAVSVVICGGYNAAYSGVNSETILQGQMVLKAGTVIVRNVRLRP